MCERVCKFLSCAPPFVTPWTVACQLPLSMEFSRQEYWCGLLFLSPEDLPDPGIEPRSPALQANCLTSEPPGKPLKRHWYDINIVAQGTCTTCEKHLLCMSFLSLKTTCFSLEYNVRAAVQLNLGSFKVGTT